ncbi:sigma-70 family RNA polymerase sigma factor [Paludisphaera mucosa]|uniref:RNA polymerase sigma factor RpoD/SigA n=1 Tax=Paludisphaera mucosa TaxID=3030827 RepID=A0ABT6FAN1_9BACT|nr:RNA polymerase sigma factor RpoD/SigA [Paludisphaera mucosa]MDG3004635.1 RNA polymerase sigma factor RpoD/SigA [Paludisphaera mucosa]
MSRIEAKDCGVSHDLQTYFHDINEVSLLTADDERRLAAEIALGDDDARTRMIAANLRLVVRIARDYQGRGMTLDDLIGEGNLGLIRASEEYDPRFGTRFSTYAGYWIKQAIRHALINTATTIRLPAHMVGLLTKWRRAERLLTRELVRAPSFDEIAGHLGLTEMQKSLVVKAKRANQVKLESGAADEDDYWSPDDSVDPDEGPSADLEARDDRADLFRRMRVLDERERMVLTYRYGLQGVAPLTLKEIGDRLGITREWVRKLELRAIRKLDTAARPPPAPAASKPAPPAARRRLHPAPPRRRRLLTRERGRRPEGAEVAAFGRSRLVPRTR